MGKIGLIIRREYLTRVRKKSFFIMTVLAPILFASLFIIPVWLATRENEEKIIRVIDHSGHFEDSFAEAGNLKFRYLSSKLSEAKKNVAKGEVSALLYIPPFDLDNPKGIKLFSAANPGIEVVSLIEETLNDRIENLKLNKAGIDADMLTKIDTSISLQVINITDKGEKETSAGVATVVGYFGAILIYFFIFYYGTQVMRGVMEEKSSRIVEILVSSVRPFQLMMGKIIGIAGVGLTQFLLWVILTLAITGITLTMGLTEFPSGQAPSTLEGESFTGAGEPFPGLISDLLTINLPLILAVFIFFFLGAYLLYAALFAMVGSAVDSETDTQQFMFPIVIPLLFSIIILSAVIKEPNGSLAFWTSMIPFTSPVVMMMRMPFGVPTGELVFSMVLLVGGFIFTTWLAGRIYRIGILVRGTKVNYRTIVRWLIAKN